MVNKYIKVGVIFFALVAVTLGIGLVVGAKREKNRTNSVKGSLAKNMEYPGCGERRVLTVPGIEYDYRPAYPAKRRFGRRLGTEAETGSTAQIISEECIGMSSNINRCAQKRVRRNLAKDTVSNLRPATPSPTDTKPSSPAPSRAVTNSPAPTICNSSQALFDAPNDTLSPTDPLTTANPSITPTTPAPTTSVPTSGPTTPEPTTLSPTTSEPTTFAPTPGPTLEPTPGPTAGSTPTVSTEATGPPTKGGREPL